MPGLRSGTSSATCGWTLTARPFIETQADEIGQRFETMPNLLESYAWCHRLTRLSRSSFYLSFYTLPRDLFRDLCVLYAFMRVSDDLGDDATVSLGERSAAINKWRTMLGHALDGKRCEHPVLPALIDVVRRRRVPREYLVDVIDGVESDLVPRIFETFGDLSDYCYHVAGAVGLCCMHIWGYTDPRAEALAVDCGLAFQLTNILRDVAEDARMGRHYLPQEDLDRFGLTTADLGTGQPLPRFRELMAYEAARARVYFGRAEELVGLCSPGGRAILDAMVRTYSSLLTAIESSSYDVHSRRIRLGLWRKMRIVLGSYWRYRLHPTGAHDVALVDPS
jgi:phytoene synthase